MKTTEQLQELLDHKIFNPDPIKNAITDLNISRIELARRKDSFQGILEEKDRYIKVLEERKPITRKDFFIGSAITGYISSTKEAKVMEAIEIADIIIERTRND